MTITIYMANTWTHVYNNHHIFTIYIKDFTTTLKETAEHYTNLGAPVHT